MMTWNKYIGLFERVFYFENALIAVPHVALVFTCPMDQLVLVHGWDVQHLSLNSITLLTSSSVLLSRSSLVFLSLISSFSPPLASWSKSQTSSEVYVNNQVGAVPDAVPQAMTAVMTSGANEHHGNSIDKRDYWSSLGASRAGNEMGIVFVAAVALSAFVDRWRNGRLYGSMKG